jgi:hypothetical protein
MSRAKQKSLLLLALAGGLVLILAMSLPGLMLSSGQPFSLEPPSSSTVENTGSSPGGNAIMPIIQGILALAMILFPLSVLYSLLTAEGRKRLIKHIILIALLFLVADYLDNLPQNENAPQLELAAMSSNLDQMGSATPAATFPDEPPEWLTAVVILVVSALVVVFARGILWFIQQRKTSPELILEKLAVEVENAIVSIHKGSDFKLTIIHCYREMSRVLKVEKGITREMFMTPREFEYRLLDIGLPREATRTLTRLFEQVRYSTLPPGTQERNLAIACLADIVDACKVIGDRHETP